MSQRLRAEGVPMHEFRATNQNFSPAIIEHDAAMRSAQLRHDGNPVLTWCIGNVVGKADDRRKLLAAIARLSIEMHAAVTASSRDASEPAAATAERRRLSHVL